MTTRIQYHLFKIPIMMILFTTMMFQSMVSQAQSFTKPSANKYKGLVVGFGTRSATLSSNIEKINQAGLLQAGGQVGFVYGNEIVRSKIGLLGYYSSTGRSAGTTDLYSSNAALNFYPLALISGSTMLIEPYITGSLDYDQFKFFGHYISQEPGEVNYSQAEAPYLGKIRQVNATIGLGVELRLKDQYDFLHLFSEVRYSQNLSTKSRDTAFDHTAIRNQTQLTIGLSFGMNR